MVSELASREKWNAVTRVSFRVLLYPVDYTMRAPQQIYKLSLYEINDAEKEEENEVRVICHNRFLTDAPPPSPQLDVAFPVQRPASRRTLTTVRNFSRLRSFV